MTITIYIADDVSEAAFAAVERLAAEVCDRDVNFACADIIVKRDEYHTWVDGRNGINCAVLLDLVHHVIGEEA